MAKLALRRLFASERRFLASKVADRTLSAYVLDRYRIIHALLAGSNPSELGRIWGCERATVYLWAHTFNSSGFSEFEKATNPHGRPAILTSGDLRMLVKIALSKPQDLRLPFTTWSVAKLSDYCRSRGLLPDVSNEWVRRLLKREGLSFQRTKTWKESPDPEFEKKKPHS
jgi:transposase